MKSRTAIVFSGLLNCLLLAIIIALAPGRGGPARPPAGSTAATEAPPAAPPEQNSPVPAPGVEPFSWAQLESTDYPTYVRNLRAIHCPEQTLRDIITADVDCNFYAARRGKLQSQEQQLAASPLENAGLRREEQELWNEESSLINRLLGVENPQRRPAAETAANLRASAPPVMPLAFAASTTNLAGFSDTQLAAVARSRQSFLTDLAGLDPNSPEYAQVWRKAQPRVDAALKASLGNSAYQKLQLEMLRQNLARPERQQ